jgi:signal transduction histidine kinase
MSEKNCIEPGLLIVFRYFLIVAIVYFAILVSVSALQINVLRDSYVRWSFINLILYLVLYLYLSVPFLRERNARWYLPVALAMAAAFPVLANVMTYLEAPEQTLPVLIQSSWLSFPVLLVPLVFIAWQYRFTYVMLFTVLAALVEEILLLPLLWPPQPEYLTIVGQPLIRAFSFGIVGHIISHMTATQRAQRRRLWKANMELIRGADMLQRLAVSRERNRLARELHDTLAHSLSALSVSLEAMKTELPASESELSRMLDRALDITRSGLNDTRRALKDIRADALEDLGLPLAVRHLAEAAAQRIGVKLDVDVEENLPGLPPPVEHGLFRITQEAIENAVHHAGSTSLNVRLAVRDDKLILSVRDDGSGFDPAGVNESNHHGILGMRERAKACGGTLTIESHEEEGTTLIYSVPIYGPRTYL